MPFNAKNSPEFQDLDGSCTRRQFLRGGASFAILLATGCKKPFVRPGAVYDLGAVKDLLYSSQIVHEFSIFVVHDDHGWAAMSTRCTYDGCDLSFQQQEFLCMCCGSVFSHLGQIYRGPAAMSLPYFGMTFREDHLFADTEQVVRPDTRFNTPELARAMENLKERIRIEGARPGAKIPDSLLGKTPPDAGMFREHHDIVIPTLQETSASPVDSPTPTLMQRLMKTKKGSEPALAPEQTPTPIEIPGVPSLQQLD